MRRIIVAVTLLLLSLGAWAQYADAGFIKRVGTHIEMDGERLSPQDQAALLADIGGHDFNAEWERARKGRNTVITSGVGLVTAGVGVPILVKNCDKLNSIVNTHNNGGIPTAQLNFGPTGNGIGLALKF